MCLTKFKTLNEAITRYGVVDFLKSEIKKQIKKFKSQGIEVELSEVFHTNQSELFTILEDGSIHKAIIHIVDITNWWGDQLPKFHIFNCRTVRDMKSNNKGHRYRASQRTDGLFYIIKYINQERKNYENLDICSNCSPEYNGQFKSNRIVSNFSIKEYLNKPIKHTEFEDVKLDICTIPKTYSSKWSDISKYMKKNKKYICQKCFFDCSRGSFKRFLHVHHKNADKSNNSRDNLEVLCIECHANEHNHSHIKNLPDYTEYLQIKSVGAYEIIK